MKKRPLLSFAVIVSMAISVALCYGDAQAFVTAVSDADSAAVHCLCVCACPSGADQNFATDHGAGFRQVYCPCVVSAAPACTVYAHGRAWTAAGDPPQSWEAVVADTMYVSRQCLRASGKKNESHIRISDSLHVEALIVGSTVAIHVAGHWRLCDYDESTVGARFEFHIQKPGYPLAGGTLQLRASPSTNWQDHVNIFGFSYYGDGPWTIDDFTGGIDGQNCLWIQIDTTYNVAFPEHMRPTALYVEGWKMHSRLPTLTQWGLIVFAGLFILSLIFMLRRKRARLPSRA